MSSGDLASAERVLKKGDPLDKKLSAPSVQTRWRSTRWHVKERQKVNQAREKLSSEPDDPRALEIVGRYECLVENAFAEGLPKLIRVLPPKRSIDKPLRDLAEADVLGPAEPDKQRALGEAWLEFARVLGEPMERNGARLRAIYWLERALPAFAGTATGHRVAALTAEARAMEFAPPLAKSPIAALKPQGDEPAGILDTELVLNGNCEERAITGGVPGWEIVSGDWIPLEIHPNQRDEKSGAFYFRPTGKQAIEEIRQDIIISNVWKEARGGAVVVTIGARVSGHFQRGAGEESQVVAEFIDSTGELTGTPLNYGPEWAGGWRDVSLSGEVPRSTKKIRLRLIAHRRRGTSNDAVFDSLSLKLSSVPR